MHQEFKKSCKVLTLELSYRGLTNCSITGPQVDNINKTEYEFNTFNQDIIDEHTIQFIKFFKKSLAQLRQRIHGRLTNQEVEACLKISGKERNFKLLERSFVFINHPNNCILNISYVCKETLHLKGFQKTYSFNPHIYITMVLEDDL